ncbi:MAG: HNH endonuclease [Armatimonadetes bacterium]|nr:HNH endonuclease [Armatimonadota bacterium]MDE2207822.1 HNH endonuclease [Armatimonadota bacterium]
MHGEVLVLNSDYEPLNVCPVRRAVIMVVLGKAEMLHAMEEAAPLRADGSLLPPSVVKLRTHVRRPLPELKLSRRTIFARDQYTCQYCASTSRELTIDHVVPRRQGGSASWENLVCCCRKCNARKGDKLMHVVGMHLRRPPRRPRYVPYISLTKYLAGQSNSVWRTYLPTFPDVCN